MKENKVRYMQIEYYIKTVYGNDLIYIANEEVATNIKILTGRQTVTSGQLEALKHLGHTIKEVLPPER